ncbi:hypothetical protein EV361DRAFT_280832 [Lentinula raphanica]|nr:hypothetical protein EV361DRAFT_280832 [Lentinula raphanica]
MMIVKRKRILFSAPGEPISKFFAGQRRDFRPLDFYTRHKKRVLSVNQRCSLYLASLIVPAPAPKPMDLRSFWSLDWFHSLVLVLFKLVVKLISASADAHDAVHDMATGQVGTTLRLEPSQTGHSEQYSIGQYEPYWPKDAVLNTVGTSFNMKYTSLRNGTPRPDKTWFIVAMLESEGIVIERDIPDIMGEAMADKQGRIKFSLRKTGNFGVNSGYYDIEADNLKLHSSSILREANPVILDLVWLENKQLITVVANRLHELKSS